MLLPKRPARGPDTARRSLFSASIPHYSIFMSYISLRYTMANAGVAPAMDFA